MSSVPNRMTFHQEVVIVFLLGLTSIARGSFSTTAGFTQTNKLSVASWDAAVQSTLTGIENLYDCAQQCREFDLVNNQDCTAIHFEGTTCTLANVIALEEQQNGVAFKV